MILRYNNVGQLLLFTLLVIVSMTSCEDKIEVDLADVDPQVVVDAWLTDDPEDQIIKLTWSQPYFDSSDPVGITDALVSIAVEDILLGFDHVGNGEYVYSPSEFQSLSNFGTDFTLLILIDDVEYTATASIHRVPEIDEIRQEIRENELGSVDGGIYCEFIARDLEGLGDTYWIKSFKNGRFLDGPDELNLAYDAGFDVGVESDGLVFIPPIRELTNPMPDSIAVADEISPWAPGDICKVEIHSINNDAFEFMTLVRDQILNGDNGIFASPLANAQGNVTASDGSTVLGVFNIAKVSRREIVVQ